MLRKLWMKLEKTSKKLKNKTGLSIVSSKSYRIHLQNSHLHMFYKHQLELYIKRVKLYNIQCRTSHVERHSIDRMTLFRFHKIQRKFHTKKPSLILYSDQSALKKHIGKFDARKIQLDASIQRQIAQYPANVTQRSSMHKELIYSVFGPIIRQLLSCYRSSVLQGDHLEV